MPNWCENDIVISSNETEAGYREMFQFMKCFVMGQPNNIVERNDQQDLVFLSIFCPIPKEEENWYDWNCENWGTKWDVNIDPCWLEPSWKREIALAELLEDPIWKDDFSFFCTSAWSPPLEGFRNISKIYPNLNFCIDYVEDGCTFAGEAEIYNGVVCDMEKDYDELHRNDDED